MSTKESPTGSRWRALVNMRIPGKGPLAPGDEFVFTQRMADAGLQPDLWLERGHAERLGKTHSLSQTVASPKPDTKPKARPAASKAPASPSKADGDSKPARKGDDA